MCSGIFFHQVDIAFATHVVFLYPGLDVSFTISFYLRTLSLTQILIF